MIKLFFLSVEAERFTDYTEGDVSRCKDNWLLQCECQPYAMILYNIL